MKKKAEVITFQDFAGIDFGKGKIQGVSGDILHVEYPSGIRLIVRAYRYKPYYVMLAKENTFLPTVYCYSKAEVLSYVRNLNREIQAGKYKNKNTLRKQAFQIVQERNLTSYMNNTKWYRLLKIVNEKLPFRPPYIYKLLSDTPDREEIQPFRHLPDSPQCWCGECFANYRFYEIEWVRITPKYAVNHGGRLVENLEIFDETEELVQELENAHIPFEKENQDIIIYGYH